MPLAPCNGCGRPTDLLAQTCPNCGRPKPTKKGRRWGVIIGGVIFCLFLLRALGGDPKKGNTSSSTSAATEPEPAAPPAPPAPPPPIEVTAIQLHRDYEANEVAADAKYKGRMLLVDGVIDSIDKDFTGDVVIHLRSGDQFNQVAATMKNASGTAELHRRQRITVTCTGGTRIIGSAMLENCALDSVWR
jgi:hypothetical protein